MSTYTIYHGELDPKRIRIRVDYAGIEVADRLLPDLTAVTALNITITNRRRRSTPAETWTTEIVEQEVDLLVADHVLEESDTATLRTLHGVVWATAAGAANPVRCGSFDLQVLEP